MIVYYVANNEKPSSSKGVRFYLDQSEAKADADENRQSVYSFLVNDKCSAENFGHETIMVFKKDLETGNLKFMASGLWDEVHDILGIPFYKDFEYQSKTFVSMSLSYFNDNYTVISNKSNKKQFKQEPVVEMVPVENVMEDSIDEDVLDELFGASEPAKPVVNPSSGDLTALLFAEAGNGK